MSVEGSESDRSKEAEALLMRTTAELLRDLQRGRVEQALQERRRGAWERLKDCRIIDLGPEDLERQGGFGDLYTSKLISDTAATCKRNADDEGYMRETKGGTGLIFKFDERPLLSSGGRGPSVLDEMRDALIQAQSAGEKRREGKYILRGIQGPNGDIVASYGLLLRPKDAKDRRDKSNPHFKKLDEFLETGVTDGGMQYIGGPHKKENHKNLTTQGVYIDIILTGIGFGADVLADDMASILEQEEPDAEDVFFYILEDFDVLNAPNQVHLRTEPRPPEFNRKSFTYFEEERGCWVFAHNPSDKLPVSMRTIDGSPAYLRPHWAWLRNKKSILNIRSRSRIAMHVNEYGPLPNLGIS